MWVKICREGEGLGVRGPELTLLMPCIVTRATSKSPAGGLKPPALVCEARLRGLSEPAKAGFVTVAGGFSPPAATRGDFDVALHCNCATTRPEI